jgi:hypothetical protein
LASLAVALAAVVPEEERLAVRYHLELSHLL